MLVTAIVLYVNTYLLRNSYEKWLKGLFGIDKFIVTVIYKASINLIVPCDTKQ